MRSKKLWINVIFAAVLLAAAGVLFWMNSGRGAGGVAELTYGDDNTVMEIPLNKDAQYDIDTGYYTIHLTVEDGRIALDGAPEELARTSARYRRLLAFDRGEAG